MSRSNVLSSLLSSFIDWVHKFSPLCSTVGARKLLSLFLVFSIFVFLTLAITSCARRTYVIKGKADSLEFEYRDSLYQKQLKI